MGVLEWGTGGSVLMVYVPGMLPPVSKVLGKAGLRAMMSKAASAQLHLRADLGKEGKLGLWGLRAELGQVPGEREGLCGIVSLMEFLKCTIFVVFLMPHGGEAQHGWDSKESWKVMHLKLFLKPPWLEEEGVIASTCNWAAGLGTLNLRIPVCSDAVYNSRICGLVASSNTQNHDGYDLGWETFLTLAMNWPTKVWGLPSWEIQECMVGLRTPCLGYMVSLILWGEDLLVLDQGYCVYLHAWVNLDSHGLHPALCGYQQLGEKGDLSHLTHTLSGGSLLWGWGRSPSCWSGRLLGLSWCCLGGTKRGLIFYALWEIGWNGRGRAVGRALAF